MVGVICMKEFTEEMYAERQNVLDIEKWLASESAGYDLCGSFAYCARCDKSETHPCARAEARCAEETQKEEQAFEEELETLETPAEAPEETQPEEAAEAPAGYELVTRYRRSFKSRLIQDEKMQDFYTDIKNAFSELTGVKTRLSRHCENFRYHAERIAKLNVGGKTLTLYLALDPSAYEDSKYRYEDVSDRKTYTETPMKIRITSKRMVKYCKELLADLAAKFSITISGCIPMDYHMKYQTDEALIKKGLIKPYEVLVKKKKK